MTFKDLCYVLGTGNVLFVYDRAQENLANGLVSAIRRDRGYLMDKEVLCVDSCMSKYWQESYIEVTLDIRKEELFR